MNNNLNELLIEYEKYEPCLNWLNNSMYESGWHCHMKKKPDADMSLSENWIDVYGYISPLNAMQSAIVKLRSNVGFECTNWELGISF